ncbi:MAG TPA: glycerophosphodiester phosphodiesterase family protein [Pseudolabrys sp.]|nr:glycerophosphodiester phosphodiesterase family protein [Pseudolabrys sp.]
MRDIDWLTARPIAHRGLHDVSAGIIENTATAFTAAIDHGYAIECDLQVSGDGEAMVHHDDSLGRLTEGTGALASLSKAALQAVRFRQCADCILTLGDLCDLAAGRTPLVIELKSRFDGDLRLVRRAAAVLAGYRGPAALMSFDPALIAWLRTNARALPRGITAERHYTHAEWARLTVAQKFRLAHLLHAPVTRPHFVAYGVKDLPAPGAWVARHLFGLPLLTWTVRSMEDRRRAAAYADQIIFEGWQP